ncbi:MAG: right-handed parallel beta-helix repeat-containing protein [Firmicutes bacterium]|nr:right-handed parallel beta-helix repeat-containing protein [Bacillota bacterium]
MKKHLSIFLALVLVLGLLAGCGKKEEPAAPEPVEPEPVETPADDGVTRVSTVKELMEAIETAQVIELQPGNYDISKFADSEDMDQWNSTHTHAVIQEYYDGNGICFSGLGDVTIRGAGHENTHLTVSPRYANVLSFESCNGLNLSGLTLGHSDGASCTAGVLYFLMCSGIDLEDLDIYGCGMTGITFDYCDTVTASQVNIHDCESDALEIYGCTGLLDFVNSEFKDNGWGIYIGESEDADISFSRCKFGQEESNSVAFEDVDLIDCEVMEPTVYPDIDPGEEGLNLTPLPLDSTVMNGSTWYFYDMTMSFNEDGTGTLSGYYDEDLKFNWELNSEDYTYSVYKDGSEDEFGFGSLYYDADLIDTEDGAPVYLSLQILDEDSTFYFEQ